MDGRLASDSIGQRSEDDLAHAHAQEHGRDDELHVIAMHYPKVFADRRERRQHRVDRQRNQGNQQRDQRYELTRTQGRV